MFWELTLHGKHCLYFYSKRGKIDFGKLFFYVNEVTNSWSDFDKGKLILKKIKPEDDNEIDWIDISP